jgi:O-antigen/teichoic acid export membrane protein
MEKKKFFSDLLFVQGINIAIKAVWILVIDRAVQDLLPTEEYGRYFSLFSFTILFIIVLDFGINNLNSRSVASDSSYFHNNFIGFLGVKFVLSLLFTIGVYGVAMVMDFSELQMQLLLPLILFQIGISFNQYLRSNVSALHKFKLDGLLAATDRVIVIAIIGSWLIFEPWSHLLTIQNFVLVQLLGVLFTLSLGMFINLRLLGKLKLKFRLPQISKLLYQSLPYALLAALMAIFTRVDAVMISYFLGDAEVDRYAMAYRLLDAGNMIAVLLAGMLLPMFSRLATDKKVLSEISGLSARLLIVPAFLVAVIVSIHPGDILGLMYPNKIDIMAPDAFGLLMWSFVGICSIYIYGTLLTAVGDLKFLNILAASCALGNVILNLFFIDLMGVKGAALATLITQSTFALGCVIKSKQWRISSDNSTSPIFIIGGLGIFAGIFFATKQFFENAFVHISLGAVVALAFVVAGGIISKETLERMSRRKTQDPSDN